MSISRFVVRRASKSTPLARALLAADVVLIAGRHMRRLDGDERRRLLALLGTSVRHGGRLGASERIELAALAAKLEPRLFVGSAVRRVSPVPIPKRVLYGRRGSPARAAAKAARRSRR